MFVDQTSAEFGKHRGIKSRIGEFQPKEILPIESSTDRVRSLLIGKVLHKLHDGNEGQSPWSQGRLAFLRKQRHKILIGVDASQDIAHLHVHVAFGIGGACYSDGFLRNWTNRVCFE